MSPVLAPKRARRAIRSARQRTVRDSAGPDDIAPIAERLVLLFHHGWATAVLAEMFQGDTHPGGCKFITLANRLGLSRGTLSATLAHLLRHDFIMRNPGTGHPMRPEYLLAEDGHDIAPHCRNLLRVLRARQLESVSLKKWSMPALAAIGAGLHRFSDLKAALPGISPRALALALKDLAAAGLITRLVTDGFPPGVIYQPAARSGRLVKLLRRLAA